MFTKSLASTALIVVLLSAVGCNHRQRVYRNNLQLVPRPMFDESAPEWVKGDVPDSKDRLYFVGRSVDPYLYGNSTGSYSASRWYNNNNRARGWRYNYNWMTEREAVSSARDDIYDQIRQRLAPRNVGAASNLVVSNIDSGTCATCGTGIPIFRTDSIVCNSTCSHSGEPCNSTSVTSFPNAVGNYCKDCHTQVAACSGCATIVHAVTQLNRTPDHLNAAGSPLDRDFNITNINVDSLMPSLAAYMTEDELYFERWDEWDSSYKCWMLCSILADEFYSIAEDFRDKYEDLYDQSLDHAEQDRHRRMSIEDENRLITIERQNEEREWNRDDEITTRAHTIEIDKDRQSLPGRRFTLE